MLEEYNVSKYGKIASDYSKSNGMFLLIKYHLDNLETITQKDIDKVYMNVFSDIRNIVEFRIPKYLSIFNNLLKYVCSLEHIDINTDNLAMESIIRFYELGVNTEFGMYLAEAGFPIPTIRQMENQLSFLVNKESNIIIENFNQYEKDFKKILDLYELKLLKKILEV